MNRLRPRWPFSLGLAAGQQHQHVGTGGERAPRLDPVDHEAGLAVRAGRCGGGDLQPGDVAAVVRLGDRHGRHHLGGGQLRQPVQLLRLGAALHEGAGEDLRAGDQRAADAQRAAAELLGGHDHAHVLAVAALVEPLVLGRHAEAERTHLGEAADDLLRHVLVEPVDVLGARLDDLVGEARGTCPAPSRSRRRGGAGRARWRTRRARRGRGYVARNGWAARIGAGSSPHSSSRPHSRVIRSWTISAANAQAIRPSTSPLAP